MGTKILGIEIDDEMFHRNIEMLKGSRLEAGEAEPCHFKVSFGGNEDSEAFFDIGGRGVDRIEIMASGLFHNERITKEVFLASLMAHYTKNCDCDVCKGARKGLTKREVETK